MAVAAGAALVALGSRYRVPYIVLLLFGGVALGPEVLGVVQPASLKGGLEALVAIAVAVILFEGGITLDLAGYRRAPVVIRRLLTVGALITWLGTSAAAHGLFGFELGMSLMVGSLVVVTGPTVVSPLLRRLNIDSRLHHILYWEGVLIDAVGVFIAVLCYEWLSPDPDHALWAPLARFGLRVVLGVALGGVTGLLIAFALNRELVPKEHASIFSLGAALLGFGVAHTLLHESGILVAVVSGLVLAVRRPPQLKRMKKFKLQVTELAIGVVFILLAAKLELARFQGWRVAALVGAVLLLRPASVLVATWGRGFKKREKAFLSWIAPRGIVAASMASLFALRLEALGYEDAVYLETTTYAVIAVTVTLQGLSAPALARVLRLKRPERGTWVVVGESTLVTKLGAAMRRAGVKVVEHTGLIDDEVLDDPRFADAYAMLCVNPTLLQNVWAASHWNVRGMRGHSYRWATDEPEHHQQDEAEGLVVWDKTISPAETISGLRDGTVALDVVELGEQRAQGRFDERFVPLFWVDKGRAFLVGDPSSAEPRGTHAIVLRRPIEQLSHLIAHVDVVMAPAPTFEDVARALLDSARRLHPELPREEILDGIIERRRTMPTAVGQGIAIPHAYWDGVGECHCFVAAVPSGIADMATPDGRGVRLVFLVISPLGQAKQHLQALGTLARLAGSPKFVELLASQEVPERLARLISERG